MGADDLCCIGAEFEPWDLVLGPEVGSGGLRLDFGLRGGILASRL